MTFARANLLRAILAVCALFAWWADPAAPQSASAMPAAAGPSVRIATPANGAVVTGPDVTVTLDVGDLKLVPGTQATHKEDLHVHYLLDVDPTPWLDGKHDIPTGDPNIVHSAATSNTFKGVKPGPHKVTVILTNADHLAIQPPVAPAVSFTVRTPVIVTSPAEGAALSGPDVTVTLDVGDLKLVPGTQATHKEDLHVHYLLDVDPTPWLDGKHDIPTGDPNIVHSAATSNTFKGVKPGPHKVTVILTNADHLAIQPPVAPAVSFTVGVNATWQDRASLPTPRYGLGVATTRDGIVYAIGGFDGTKSLATVEAYNPATNAWTARASMPTARYDLGAVAAGNGKIYAVGGFDGATRLGTIEEYDPTTNTWATRASMPTARSALGVATSGNGRVYAIGGCGGSLCDRLGTVEEYDPTTNTWAARANMPTARSALGVAAASNGRIFAIGGCAGQFCDRLAGVEEFDPATNTWTAKAAMPTARDSLGVAVAGSRIYAVGGSDGHQSLSTVEEYDPASNQWSEVAALPTARNALGLVGLADGRILTVGGYGGGAGPVEAGTIAPRSRPVQPQPTPAPSAAATPAPAQPSASPAATPAESSPVAAGTAAAATPAPAASAEASPSAVPAAVAAVPAATPAETAGPTALPTVVPTPAPPGVAAASPTVATSGSVAGAVASAPAGAASEPASARPTGNQAEAPPSAGLPVGTLAPAAVLLVGGILGLSYVVLRRRRPSGGAEAPLESSAPGPSVVAAPSAGRGDHADDELGGTPSGVTAPAPAVVQAAFDQVTLSDTLAAGRPMSELGAPPRLPRSPTGSSAGSSSGSQSGSQPGSPVGPPRGDPIEASPSGLRIVGEPKLGGMAAVYRAYQPSLDRYVALKIILPQLLKDGALVPNFQQEARRTAKLEHPNIVTVYDTGELPDGALYIAMRYIDGLTLRELLDRERWLPIGRAAHIAIAVAEALDYAHYRGVVHRDVKPSNIMVEMGDRVTLTDFGIAMLWGDPNASRPGAVIGTPRYVSPEQAAGHPVDHRSDIYSLGVVLYEMLTGRAPFLAEGQAAVLQAHISLPPRPPRQLNPEIPAKVEAVVLKALSKDPAQRQQSANQFVDELRAATAGADARSDRS